MNLEKHYIIAGDEFGHEKGKIFIVVRALYGLKSASAAFRSFMAKKLDEANSLMFVGGGAKGSEPLVMSEGGKSYRAFMEGRIKDETYCLILHLTDLEMKEITK